MNTPGCSCSPKACSWEGGFTSRSGQTRGWDMGGWGAARPAQGEERGARCGEHQWQWGPRGHFSGASPGSQSHCSHHGMAVSEGWEGVSQQELSPGRPLPSAASLSVPGAVRPHPLTDLAQALMHRLLTPHWALHLPSRCKDGWGLPCHPSQPGGDR